MACQIIRKASCSNSSDSTPIHQSGISHQLGQIGRNTHVSKPFSYPPSWAAYSGATVRSIKSLSSTATAPPPPHSLVGNSGPHRLKGAAHLNNAYLLHTFWFRIKFLLSLSPSRKSQMIFICFFLLPSWCKLVKSVSGCLTVKYSGCEHQLLVVL